MENNIKILPYPEGYRAAATISFDYETAIISGPLTFLTRTKKLILKLSNRSGITKRKISSEDYREGAKLTFKLLSEYGFHATWFGIGHTLLKENISRNRYRINQKLMYAPKETPYRTSYLTFYNEPYSDYKKYSHFYFGDITKEFYNNGEDIQYHTFSHPYLALEPDANIKIDIEDWQNTAKSLGYEPARIFAFPFLSDCYYYYPQYDLVSCNRVENKGKVDIIPIDNTKLNILHENGIRLVTRSGYFSQNKPFKSMRKYLNSDLYYVHSRNMKLAELTEENLELFFDEMIKNEWMVDFWSHNWNVFENPGNFELFLKVLDRKRKDIWVPTLNEFWNYQVNTGNQEK